MQESLLHYIWQNHLYDPAGLTTTDGQDIQVIRSGVPNPFGGPDFSDAEVLIGDMHWHGHVEIHVSASEWYQHGHDSDPAYHNVILHVVYHADRDVLNHKNSVLPCLSLASRIPPLLLQRYHDLMHSAQWIPCGDRIHAVPDIIFSAWQERLIAERFIEKGNALLQKHVLIQGDWEELYYRWCGQGFGLKANQEAMNLLTQRVPFRLLRLYLSQPTQAEALHLGAAGLLEFSSMQVHPHFLQLKSEWEFLSKKHQIESLPAHIWKYAGIRPSNFPAIRIAQFAAHLSSHPSMVSQLLDCKNIDSLKQFFQITLHIAWDTHYTLNEPSPPLKKKLGNTFIHLLLINVVIPFLYFRSNQTGDITLQERVIQWLMDLPPEKNVLLEKWNQSGVAAKDAFASQALIHLKSRYCDEKQCLRCAAGNYLIQHH